MNWFEKYLLLKQELVIKYFRELKPEDLNDLPKNTDFKVDIEGNLIKIKDRRSLFNSGRIFSINTTGKVSGELINFTFEFSAIRQAQFMTFIILGIFFSISLHWVFLIPSLVLYGSLRSQLIIRRQLVVEMFERMWMTLH